MNRFFFHYNKPASQSKKKPILSVHYKGKCIMVEKIDCVVPIESKNSKRQPRCVMQGFAKKVEVKNAVAIIS